MKSIMSWLFGKRKTASEMLRENQRLLKRTIRDLDRERMNMEKQEKKIIADIKNMAKDLVRSKRYVKKFIMMKTQITAVSLKIQTLKSQDAMANAMKGVTKAMGRMNKQMSLPQMQKVMMEFQKQSEMMDMKQEIMEDTMDDAMEGEDDEEESEKIVAQVLGELGLQKVMMEFQKQSEMMDM